MGMCEGIDGGRKPIPLIYSLPFLNESTVKFYFVYVFLFYSKRYFLNNIVIHAIFHQNYIHRTGILSFMDDFQW